MLAALILYIKSMRNISILVIISPSISQMLAAAFACIALAAVLHVNAHGHRSAGYVKSSVEMNGIQIISVC